MNEHISEKELKTIEDIKDYVDYILWSSNYTNTKRDKLIKFERALIKINDIKVIK